MFSILKKNESYKTKQKKSWKFFLTKKRKKNIEIVIMNAFFFLFVYFGFY
jgi:hypothetical protein